VILIALGANLPGPDGAPALETCRRAAVELDRLPGLRLRALSRWFATAPVPPTPGVPEYLNGVALLACRPGHAAPPPEALLAALQAIEARFGRVRPYPNAPRTLDLDLLDLDGLVRAAPDPVLPHPRLHLRAFVLAPLLDVAPGWRHPVACLDAAGLLAEAGAQGVRALD
jgi:2-amino-4-hydroxy-6-hydroxymethyldihydropteridine diphosphokinase